MFPEFEAVKVSEFTHSDGRVCRFPNSVVSKHGGIAGLAAKGWTLTAKNIECYRITYNGVTVFVPVLTVVHKEQDLEAVGL